MRGRSSALCSRDSEPNWEICCACLSLRLHVPKLTADSSKPARTALKIVCVCVCVSGDETRHRKQLKIQEQSSIRVCHLLESKTSVMKTKRAAGRGRLRTQAQEAAFVSSGQSLAPLIGFDHIRAVLVVFRLRRLNHPAWR